MAKFFTPTVIFTKACGKMIYFIKKESIHAKMDIFTMVNGTKVKNKERGLKAGKMDKFILENLKMVLSMVGES